MATVSLKSLKSLKAVEKAGNNVMRNTFQLRKQSGISVKELSGISGVSMAALYYMENLRQWGCSYTPSLKTVARLAFVAEVSIEDYLGGKLQFE